MFFQTERFLRLFHKFFEPRIITYEIPQRMQAHLSVVKVVGGLERCVQLLDRGIFFAGPGKDLGKIHHKR